MAAASSFFSGLVSVSVTYATNSCSFLAPGSTRSENEAWPSPLGGPGSCYSVPRFFKIRDWKFDCDPALLLERITEFVAVVTDCSSTFCSLFFLPCYTLAISSDFSDFSGFSLHSQYIFIEDKHNGFADFKAPTEWWTKKSAHVIFRRPLTVLNSDESFILKED